MCQDAIFNMNIHRLKDGNFEKNVKPTHRIQIEDDEQRANIQFYARAIFVRTQPTIIAPAVPRMRRHPMISL